MVTFVTYLAVYLMLLAAYISVLKYMAEHPPKLADANTNTTAPIPVLMPEPKGA
jgi:presenilin-like A22 family membrane protease